MIIWIEVRIEIRIEIRKRYRKNNEDVEDEDGNGRIWGEGNETEIISTW